MAKLGQEVLAEALGTAGLLATIVGAGMMADNLSGGNDGVALLGTTIPIGAILYVLITIFGPISGAHFNPAVTLVNFLKKEITGSKAMLFVATQIVSGILGVFLVHAMFDVDIVQVSEKVRYGPAQWLSEIVATFGLLLTILLTVRYKEDAVPLAVALYITAAIYFTASTCFANPAVSIARSLTNTFTGIEPNGVLPFIAAEIIGAVLALYCASYLMREPEPDQH